jgi:hypothetical protein
MIHRLNQTTENSKLRQIEAAILDVLANTSKPLKLYEIKRSRQALKRLGKNLFNRIPAGMARQGITVKRCIYHVQSSGPLSIPLQSSVRLLTQEDEPFRL